LIRTATRADIAPIDALLARSYPKLLKPDYPPSVLVTALPLISRAQPGLITCGTYYVAEIGDEIVGAGGWTPQRRRRRTGDIRHVISAADRTRQGIGRALLAHILGVARKGGITCMDCQATCTAVPFYKAMGFAELGPIEIELRPGIVFPAVRMRRRL